MTYDEFLKEWHNGDDFITVKTSGSTGTPKVMHVEKERMLASARMTCNYLGLVPGNTALLCMPLDYIAGKMMVVRTLERSLKLTATEPALIPHVSRPFDLVAMVPAQVYSSINEPWLLQSGNIIIGGGAISEELQLMIDKAGFEGRVFSSYGMTETLSHIALRRLNGKEASGWYTTLPGVNVSLTDDGCLIIQAPHLCKEPLTTNDIAEIRTLDGQTAFRIRGRKDNVVCSGGIKIQIEEVEELLRPHLQVPYLITHKPDPKFGQALVLLTEGGNKEELLAICKSVLPKYWCPKEVVITDKIPMTETGKPARRQAMEVVR